MDKEEAQTLSGKSNALIGGMELNSADPPYRVSARA
jgi:hypothetical protein